MRTLKSQNLVHDNNYAQFPEGAIINETDEIEGTPVVREVYNDLLMNVYALLKDRGININNLEDSVSSGYQFNSALKLVVNDLVDRYKLLQKRPNDLLLQIDLNLIPTGTVLHVKSTENLEQGVTYTLTDLNGSVFNLLVKSKISGADDCILIFDGNQSSVTSLNPQSISNSNDLNFPVFGNPISVNSSSSKIWYFENGILFTIDFDFYNLQVLVNEFFGGVDDEVVDVIQASDVFLIMIYNKSEMFFKMVSFDLISIQSVSYDGPALSQDDIGIDDINIYSDGLNVYYTNQGGSSTDDNIISKYQYSKSNNQLKHISNYPISDSFVKGSNVVVRNDFFYALETNQLRTYRNNGTIVDKPTYGVLFAQIFKAGSNYYITDGSNAKKIQL